MFYASDCHHHHLYKMEDSSDYIPWKYKETGSSSILEVCHVNVTVGVSDQLDECCLKRVGFGFKLNVEEC